jgi:hypothetical protein
MKICHGIFGKEIWGKFKGNFGKFLNEIYLIFYLFSFLG